MFGQIAGRYDFLNHVLSAGTDYYWRWRTVRAASKSLTGPILDVCTGTGDLALALRKKYGHRARVVATDFTHEMLALADRKAERSNSRGPAIPFLEADTQALPFADDTFELVTVAFGLRNVTDTLLGLQEMRRVCKPGGEVFVLEFSSPNVPVLCGLYQWYFKNILPRVGQMLARNKESAYDYLPRSVSEFPSGKALGALMERAGLTDVRITPLTLGVASLYRARKPASEGVDSARRGEIGT